MEEKGLPINGRVDGWRGFPVHGRKMDGGGKGKVPGSPPCHGLGEL